LRDYTTARLAGGGRVKTLSEHRAEQKTAADHAAATRLAEFHRLLAKVEAQDIDVHYGSHDSTDYAAFRVMLRDCLQRGAGMLLDVCCDDCGTRLINHEPGYVMLSSPPCRYACCPGCGKLDYVTG